MRKNTNDFTLERNYIQKWRFLIAEYEQVKAGDHPIFKRVGAFYKHHNTCSQTFRKYYNRYLQSGDDLDLMPRKRGPKWRMRCLAQDVEDKIVAYRKQGLNRYEIYGLLSAQLTRAPSLSTIYRVFKRNGLNVMKPPMKEEKRKIIKHRVGELGHIDLHQLSRDMFLRPPKDTHYVVAVLDDYSRLCWAGVTASKKALSVMFRALEIINTLNVQYQVQFEEMLSDNGSEFASPQNKDGHPFEMMLTELGIKHRYTRPYRPQTNGKIERFWRSMEDELIDGATYDDIDEFKEELVKYMIYYNELRPHQGINAKTPANMAQS